MMDSLDTLQLAPGLGRFRGPCNEWEGPSEDNGNNSQNVILNIKTEEIHAEHA